MGPFWGSIFSQQRSPFWFIKCEIFLKTNTPSLHNLPFQSDLAMLLCKINAFPISFYPRDTFSTSSLRVLLVCFPKSTPCCNSKEKFPGTMHPYVFFQQITSYDKKKIIFNLYNECHCDVISTMSFSNSKFELMLDHRMSLMLLLTYLSIITIQSFQYEIR